MDDNLTNNSNDSSQINEKNILRVIFLNILISIFIIMCYFYLSEFFGSISTPFVKNVDFPLFIFFSFPLFVFTLFSILAGKFHGFIAGLIGEFLYQLAYYDVIYIHWCFIVAIWGFACGIFKYKPMKYQKLKNLGFTMVILFVSSLITIFLMRFVYQSSINHCIEFLIQSLLTVIFLIPLVLFFYDKALATEERHFYQLLFTHHPISQSDHTFYFKFGRTYVYFCTRCSGIMMGGIIAYFLTHLFESIYNVEVSPEIAIILCIIFPIPGLIDWGAQRMLVRKATTETRLMTGFIIGSALHLLSFTQKYTIFMIFIVILYFSIFGILLYFGSKKEMRLLEQEEQTTPSTS